MDYGQPVNNPNQEPFFTAGSGNVLGNPDIDKSLNTDAYSLERDPRTMGNTAFSSANQEIFSQPPEATTEINGDLRAKPATTPELVPAPEIDPNSVQLGVQIETSPPTKKSNQLPRAIDANLIERDRKGGISTKTLNAVIGKVQEFHKPGSSESPAELTDIVNQAREDYRKTFETPYYTGEKAA